jgi:hypothetical protein
MTEPAASLTELELRAELFDAMDGNLRMSRRKKLLDAYREAVLASVSVPSADQTTDRAADSHSCDNCEGIDPATCLTRPKADSKADDRADLRQRIADAVLAVLPEPTDRATILTEAADCAYRIARRLDEQHHDERAQGAWDVENALRAELRRLAAEAQPTTKPEPESCAHCGKTVRRISGTLTEWWVHDPGGQAFCYPWQPASSPRATPQPAAGARQDGAQPQEEHRG